MYTKRDPSNNLEGVDKTSKIKSAVAIAMSPKKHRTVTDTVTPSGSPKKTPRIGGITRDVLQRRSPFNPCTAEVAGAIDDEVDEGVDALEKVDVEGFLFTESLTSKIKSVVAIAMSPKKHRTVTDTVTPSGSPKKTPRIGGITRDVLQRRSPFNPCTAEVAGAIDDEVDEGVDALEKVDVEGFLFTESLSTMRISVVGGKDFDIFPGYRVEVLDYNSKWYLDIIEILRRHDRDFKTS